MVSILTSKLINVTKKKDSKYLHKGNSASKYVCLRVVGGNTGTNEDNTVRYTIIIRFKTIFSLPSSQSRSSRKVTLLMNVYSNGLTK